MPKNNFSNITSSTRKIISLLCVLLAPLFVHVQAQAQANAGEKVVVVKKNDTTGRSVSLHTTIGDTYYRADTTTGKRNRAPFPGGAKRPLGRTMNRPAQSGDKIVDSVLSYSGGTTRGSRPEGWYGNTGLYTTFKGYVNPAIGYRPVSSNNGTGADPVRFPGPTAGIEPPPGTNVTATATKKTGRHTVKLYPETTTESSALVFLWHHEWEATDEISRSQWRVKQTKTARYLVGSTLEPNEKYNEKGGTIDYEVLIDGVSSSIGSVSKPLGMAGKAYDFVKKLQSVVIPETETVTDFKLGATWEEIWNQARTKQSGLTNQATMGPMFESDGRPAYYFYPKELGQKTFDNRGDGIFIAYRYMVVYKERQNYHADHYGVNGYIDSGTVIQLTNITHAIPEAIIADSVAPVAGVGAAFN